MNLLLIRDDLKQDFSRGEMFLDAKHFLFTVEDAVRPEKIPGITAIPEGIYKIIITQSARFGRALPLLLEVPNYSGVRIHPGNTAADTEGCILVGMFRTDNGVAASRSGMEKLQPIIQAALDRGEEVTINIKNSA